MKTASYLIAVLVLATAGAAIGAEDSSTTAAASAAPVAAAAAATAKPVQVQVARPLTRADVRAQVIEARKNGTMIETEADMDVARTRNQLAR